MYEVDITQHRPRVTAVKNCSEGGTFWKGLDQPLVEALKETVNNAVS